MSKERYVRTDVLLPSYIYINGVIDSNVVLEFEPNVLIWNLQRRIIEGSKFRSLSGQNYWVSIVELSKKFKYEYYSEVWIRTIPCMCANIYELYMKTLSNRSNGFPSNKKHSLTNYSPFINVFRAVWSAFIYFILSNPRTDIHSWLLLLFCCCTRIYSLCLYLFIVMFCVLVKLFKFNNIINIYIFK